MLAGLYVSIICVFLTEIVGELSADGFRVYFGSTQMSGHDLLCLFAVTHSDGLQNLPVIIYDL